MDSSASSILHQPQFESQAVLFFMILLLATTICLLLLNGKNEPKINKEIWQHLKNIKSADEQPVLVLYYLKTVQVKV